MKLRKLASKIEADIPRATAFWGVANRFEVGLPQHFVIPGNIDRDIGIVSNYYGRWGGRLPVLTSVSS